MFLLQIYFTLILFSIFSNSKKTKITCIYSIIICFVNFDFMRLIAHDKTSINVQKFEGV
jgi:phosphate starvation-inducible membrane PsiE